MKRLTLRIAPAATLAVTLAGLTACAEVSAEGDYSVDDGCEHAANFPTLSADPANDAWEDPQVGVSCDEDSVVVTSNGIPNYEFVEMTPNGLSEQDHAWSIPRVPTLADSPSEIPLLGDIAFTVNGLPIYGPNEGEFPDPYGDPVYNAIVDFCLGHTAQRGDYHYHALIAECVLGVDSLPEDEPSPILGYALDGFPIYGPYGCLDEGCDEVVELRSSYEQTGDPTTYAWDNHQYVERSGEEYLDACNGRIGPDGTYRYHATAEFPYVLGCYAGQ